MGSPDRIDQHWMSSQGFLVLSSKNSPLATDAEISSLSYFRAWWQEHM